MINESQNMTCQEFQALLPELIDAGIEVKNHPHYRECPSCRALLADLEAMVSAARQLLSAEEEPSDRLWDEIEKAIKVEEAQKNVNQSPGASSVG